MRAITAVGMVGLLLCVLPAGAELTAQQVLDRALAVQDRVQDYTADCTLSAKLPGQEIPTRRFQVYFKRPDQVKIESSDLVMVPREALTLGNLRRHLERDMEASLAGVGSLGEERLYCIKLKPREASRPERVLVWIRSGNWTPTYTELWQGQTRLVQIWWTFALIQEQYWMPTSIVGQTPAGVVAEEGSLVVRLGWENYRVNTGLSDELFQ